MLPECVPYPDRHPSLPGGFGDIDAERLRGPLRPALPGQDVAAFARREQVGLRVSEFRSI